MVYLSQGQLNATVNFFTKTFITNLMFQRNSPLITFILVYLHKKAKSILSALQTTCTNCFCFKF